jgi:hypothetical protein
LKKPFEASLLLAAIGRFGAGVKTRSKSTARPPSGDAIRPVSIARSVVVLDPEQVRAAVTVALDASLPALVDEISAKVLAALSGSGRRGKTEPVH